MSGYEKFSGSNQASAPPPPYGSQQPAFVPMQAQPITHTQVHMPPVVSSVHVRNGPARECCCCCCTCPFWVCGLFFLVILIFPISVGTLLEPVETYTLYVITVSLFESMEESVYPNMGVRLTGEAQPGVAYNSILPPAYGSPNQAQPTFTAVVDISPGPEHGPNADTTRIPPQISDVMVGSRTSRECSCCCPCCYCTCSCPSLPCWAWFLLAFTIVIVLALTGLFMEPHPLILPPPPPPPLGPSMFDQEASKMIAFN